jgi:Holliday junction resolvase RusA-like endonuclease
MSFRLRVYGSPVPQGRPRATVIAGHAHVYERREDKAWKETVRAQVLATLDLGEEEEWEVPALLVGPVVVRLTFFMPRPKSLPKRVVHHVKRPDCDNLAKSVKDALRGLVYRDDAQVTSIWIRKQYDPRPGVDIVVESEEWYP